MAVGVVALVLAGLAVKRQQSAARELAALSTAMTIVESPVQAPNPAVPPRDGQPGKMAEQQPGTYPTEEAKLTAAVLKLLAVADAYPNGEAGLLAQFYLGQVYDALEKPAEAAAAFDAVVAAGGTSLHVRMARLGKANAQARMGQYAAAIATFKDLTEAEDLSLPVDGLLMELASTYLEAGDTDKAKKTFSRVVHEHPASPYAAEAGKHLQ
jgi:TolA-binding protein